MEESSSINDNKGKETPPGNYAGRRNRLQQDCTVKLFPPISVPAIPGALAPGNLEPPAISMESSALTSATSSRNFERTGQHCRCCCHCSCKRNKKRCESRALGSAILRCSGRSSSLSSWSSCSSRSSLSSNCSSVGGREMSSLTAVSRTMETKDAALKRVAEELANSDHIPIEHLEKMNSRGDPCAPPPSRVLTGAHFLDWYIPRHVAGSRALNRSAKLAAAKRAEIASPMHKPEKQAWITQIIGQQLKLQQTHLELDPKTTSLRLPTPPKPPVLEYSCPRADNLSEAFSKDQINTNPSSYASYLANSHYLSSSSSFPPPNFSSIKHLQSAAAPFKSLQLKSNGRSGDGLAGGGVEPMSGPMFTKSQVPNKTWFVVHPDWRMEPKPGEDIM